MSAPISLEIPAGAHVGALYNERFAHVKKLEVERERVLRDRDGGLDSFGRQVPAPRDLSGA